MQTLIAKALGVFLILGLTFSLGYSYRDNKADQEALIAQNNYLKQLNVERQSFQGALDEISGAWQAQVQKTQFDADRAIADLRRTGIRLRVKLADATVCTVTGSCGPNTDGSAELHPEASGFLIGEAKRADAQVKALQDVVKVLQGGSDAQTKDRP